MAPWTNTSVDVDGAGGVGAGAGCTGAVDGEDEVALLSDTSSATDLCARGTLANASVIVLPFLSCISS